MGVARWSIHRSLGRSRHVGSRRDPLYSQPARTVSGRRSSSFDFASAEESDGSLTGLRCLLESALQIPSAHADSPRLVLDKSWDTARLRDVAESLVGASACTRDKGNEGPLAPKWIARRLREAEWDQSGYAASGTSVVSGELFETGTVCPADAGRQVRAPSLLHAAAERRGRRERATSTRAEALDSSNGTAEVVQEEGGCGDHNAQERCGGFKRGKGGEGGAGVVAPRLLLLLEAKLLHIRRQQRS
ncbi:hypothetical protein MRX96_002861 [Rhipicephalus microplus]